MANNISKFSQNCTDCSRLAKYLKEVRKKYPKYYAKPISSFGSTHPKLLVVGLAPGLHGANATGRPFTGDHAGILLYQMLYKHGYSNQISSTGINDGLKLKSCRITNAVRCLPPENKPIGEEVNNCNRYLADELKTVNKKAVILCLGQIAHRSTIKALSLNQSEYFFKHGKSHKLNDGRIVIDSYHCSRYNTQTKRLTEAMFNNVFLKINKQLEI